MVFKRVSGEGRCPSGCQARCLCICVGEARARKLVSFADPRTRDGLFLFSPGLIPAPQKTRARRVEDRVRTPHMRFGKGSGLRCAVSDSVVLQAYCGS